MKILLTGGSSFTGYWFAKELSVAGHEVTCTLTRSSVEAYAAEPIRTRRVQALVGVCRPVFDVRFGDETFLELVRSGFDLVCHHAADVSNYRSPDFDVAQAFANNTRGIVQVIGAMQAGGCVRLLLTGSVFEGGEGAGSEGLPHFSPYGLSKALTAQAVRFYCEQAGFRLGKFVIPNPFGPLEEPRFTNYLMKTWYAGGHPAVRTPAYVRDNIHVSLLAKAYARFAANLSTEAGFQRLGPIGYVESQGAFALRFAAEMQRRLDIPCPVTLERQTEFLEPRIRVNTDLLVGDELGFDEGGAWDEIADYYRSLFRG